MKLHNNPGAMPTHVEINEAASTWPASLTLAFDADPEHGCRMNRCEHSGPLRVQKPFYPEDRHCAHIYLLHPPGGLVSGDQLTLDITLSKNAHTLMTTPGAGKAYRARRNGTKQQQQVLIHADTGAVMEWMPQETIVFPGAEVSLTNRITLARHAVFIGWDIVCLGRPANKLPFDSGCFEQVYQLWRNEHLLFTERLVIDEENFVAQSSCGLNHRSVVGTFFATLPDNGASRTPDDNRTLMDELRQRCIDLGYQHDAAVSLVRGLCIARYLGDNTEAAKRLFQNLWQVLRPRLLGRQACAPRIWFT